MDLIEINERLREKWNLIKSTESEIEELKMKATKLAPCQVGDKVEVTHGPNTTVCFVSSIVFEKSYGDGGDYFFDYKFTKPKKDGTMGQIGSGVYYSRYNTTIRKV